MRVYVNLQAWSALQQLFLTQQLNRSKLKRDTFLLGERRLVSCNGRRLETNELRKRRDLYKVLSQHFPTGNKPTEDKELPISGQTDSMDCNRHLPSKIDSRLLGLFTVQASFQSQDTVL
jgi:hypothetical protein